MQTIISEGAFQSPLYPHHKPHASLKQATYTNLKTKMTSFNHIGMHSRNKIKWEGFKKLSYSRYSFQCYSSISNAILFEFCWIQMVQFFFDVGNCRFRGLSKKKKTSLVYERFFLVFFPVYSPNLLFWYYFFISWIFVCIIFLRKLLIQGGWIFF